MTEPGVQELEAALARHASETGEVYPSALGLIRPEEHWSGRLWDVTRLVMSDQETMRYLAGGNRPSEIASCAARWSDSGLDLGDIKMILEAGGYDPDPFVPLAGADLLYAALHLGDGSPRLIHGERAGVWISDTLALCSGQEVLERVAHEISESVSSE